METTRLHTRAEWLRVQQRYQQTLDAYTTPLWGRQPAVAVALPWRLWFYCWSLLPAAVNTLVRWLPFVVLIAWVQFGSLGALGRVLGRVPGLIALGFGRLVADPVHSLLLLATAWMPLGLGAFLYLIAVGLGRVNIFGWSALWSGIWMQPWNRLESLWSWWGYGNDPSDAWAPAGRQRPAAPPDLSVPDWADYQMAQEARTLGLDWVPPRLRPKGDAAHAGEIAARHPAGL